MASGRVKYSSPSILPGILSSLWLWLCLLILTVEILSPSQSQSHYEDWKPLLGLNSANATSVNRNLADHNAGRPEKHRAKRYLSGKLLHTFNGTSTFQLQRELQACGDISPNPGPKGKPNLKYPCSECHKSVRQNQDGIRCVQCSTWFPVKCLHMTDTIFKYYLKYPDIDWTCTLCALPSFSESFFMDSENEFSDSSFSSSEDQLNEELSYSAFSESSLSVGSTNQLQHSLEGTDGEGIVTNINSDDFYLHQFSKETRRGENMLNIAQLNICSIKNKIDEVRMLLQVCKFDILAITESHLDKSVGNKQLYIDNYRLMRRDRINGKKGGECIVYVANYLAAIQLRHLENPALEAIWIKLHRKTTSAAIGLVDRAPNENGFFDEFSKQVEQCRLKNKNLILIGDFNVNFLDQVANTGTDFSNNEATSTTNKLQSILSQFELSVVNKEPTRVTETSATLIDLVITNRPRWIKNSRVLDIGISDHKLVASTPSLKVTRPKPKIVETRNYKSFDEEKFQRDLQEAP